MSWSNPSKSEAQREYYSSRSQYYNAASQQSRYRNQEDYARKELSAASNQYSECSKSKINFQRRVRDIEKIIGCLEGNGSGISMNVPQILEKANASAKEADNAFRQCIRCSGITPPPFDEVFKAKAVTEEQNFSAALEEYKKEKARLEQEIRDLENRMRQLNDQAETLRKRINELNALQQDCRRSMNRCVVNMYHYRRYM